MVADAFQLPAGQIEEAFAIARGLARRRNVFTVELTADDLFDACRRQSARQLIAFAQRIEPRAGLRLERVVLPPPNQRQLLDLQHRIRHHRRVFTFSGLGDRMRLGKGILALFVGGSGTGKTLAAEVLASEQKVDLYKVDLAAVTSKWLGETEKNLSRIFADAESSNAMLFFDEADALFGARGEIHEARDRWANLEVNFLLQRIEEYSGIVILATNLRQNLDEAFVRRINAFVDFPLPDSDSRYRIWKHLLPPAPGSAVQDTELNDLAGRFELAGGSIQNVVLDASYRALGCDPPVITLRHLIAGVTRESQKISRPITAVEFGERYYQWAIEDVLAPAATPGLATAVS
jgi:SpoVK/Ycf46/Vps4 family AAA+-type ATPase